MTGRAHPQVDAYIAGLPDWQQAICTELREVVWATAPGIEETIKRTVQPYFLLDGTVCARWRRRTTSTCSSTTPPSPTPTA